MFFKVSSLQTKIWKIFKKITKSKILIAKLISPILLLHKLNNCTAIRAKKRINKVKNSNQHLIKNNKFELKTKLHEW